MVGQNMNDLHLQPRIKREGFEISTRELNPGRGSEGTFLSPPTHSLPHSQSHSLNQHGVQDQGLHHSPLPSGSNEEISKEMTDLLNQFTRSSPALQSPSRSIPPTPLPLSDFPASMSMGFGGYSTSSARFDDDDLLALVERSPLLAGRGEGLVNLHLQQRELEGVGLGNGGNHPNGQHLHHSQQDPTRGSQGTSAESFKKMLNDLSRSRLGINVSPQTTHQPATQQAQNSNPRSVHATRGPNEPGFEEEEMQDQQDEGEYVHIPASGFGYDGFPNVNGFDGSHHSNLYDQHQNHPQPPHQGQIGGFPVSAPAAFTNTFDSALGPGAGHSFTNDVHDFRAFGGETTGNGFENGFGPDFMQDQEGEDGKGVASVFWMRQHLQQQQQNQNQNQQRHLQQQRQQQQQQQQRQHHHQPMNASQPNPGFFHRDQRPVMEFLSRQATQATTPSLIGASSVSSYGDSLFSSIMGGKWGGIGEYSGPSNEHGRMGRPNTSGGTPATTVMSMNSQGSEKSPTEMNDGDGPEVEMTLRGEEEPVIKPMTSRGRTQSTSKMGAGGKPKVVRRSSSIAAAASGGSAVRGESVGTVGGVGKAPRGTSKTRPSHQRTGSSVSRAPGNIQNQGQTSSGSSGANSGNVSQTLSPATAYDHFALPTTLDIKYTGRPGMARKSSDSVLAGSEHVIGPTSQASSAARLMTMAQQRKTTGRAPSSATMPTFAIDEEDVRWRRHSMNDMVSGGRPELNGDGMATVDEAAIEDGDAEDSPQVLTPDALAKARLSRRRLSHNEVERKRRETINEKIQELETLLPPTVVASAIAAREVESIKEEDEDNFDAKPETTNSKGKKAKPRNRKIIKKAQVPDKLCKGTVLCLTVDLVKQMQEMLHLKTAREQQMMMQIQSLQSQLGMAGPSMMHPSIYINGNVNGNINHASDPFSSMTDMGPDDLRSINELDFRGLVEKRQAEEDAIGNDRMHEHMMNDDIAALVDFRE